MITSVILIYQTGVARYAACAAMKQSFVTRKYSSPDGATKL